MLAIKSGINVYCQSHSRTPSPKPVALTHAAREYKVMTQMGNQGHCGEGNRQLCEMIWSGAIGPVREVHCWSDRPIWPAGMKRPSGQCARARDFGLGPVGRPRADASLSRQMAGWAAGLSSETSGAVGGISAAAPVERHGLPNILDGAVWSLKLGPPTSVEIVDSSPLFTEMGPSWSIP